MSAIGRSELQIIIDLYEYNSYVRNKYLKAIFDKIPEEERYKEDLDKMVVVEKYTSRVESKLNKVRSMLSLHEAMKAAAEETRTDEVLKNIKDLLEEP